MAPKDSAERDGPPTIAAFATLTNWIDITAVSGRSSRSPVVHRREERSSRVRRKYRHPALVLACSFTAALKLGSYPRKWGPSALIQISTVFLQPSFAFVHIFFEDVRFCRNAGKEHLHESHCIVSL
jgi:hypothetical protein